MENSHRTNILVTSCLKTPVDPHTKAPLALYERERALPYAAGDTPDNRDYEKEMEYDSGSESSDGEGRGERGSPLVMKNSRVSGQQIDLRDFYFSNEEYYRKLEELKRAHLQTMSELEGMYGKKLEIKAVGPLNTSAGDTHRSQLEKNDAMTVTNLRKAFSAIELNRVTGSSLSDTSEEDVADNDLAMEKGLLSSPREHIRTMWQDFTVGQLTPRNRHPSSSSQRGQWAGLGGGSGRGKGSSGRKEEGREHEDGWRHRITVPRPFQMTLREAEKKRRKVKSRSEVELENALLKKQLEEVTECRKKFRASPVPAHVYLPLYEELTVRNEERRQLLRHRGPRDLPASQKPFAFLERERQKKEQRDAQLRDLAPKRERAGAFRAKPVPRSVYDSTVRERLEEDQLYRAIKMQMRAQELLHGASMPRSMLAKRLAERRRDADERAVATEADFRPRINGEVPDFDASYRKFRRQLENRRDVKLTTVCEPFRLRTARISSRHDRVPADMEAEQTSAKSTRWPCVAPAARTASSSLGSSLSESQELLPARITDAAKMRQEAVRKALEQRRKAEEEEERWWGRQRQRERRLQKVIAKRAQANDPHVALSQTCKTKLKQFRKQNLQRRKEYQQEMREIQKRVKGRPLLLEQVAQSNAKQAAQRRYTDTLRGHGLSEDFVSSRAPKQQQQGLPVDQSSVSSEGKESGKEEPAAGWSAHDYPDDYEEFDDQEACGEEKEPDEGNPEHRKGTGDDKADQSDQEVDENGQHGDTEDRSSDSESDGSKEGEAESSMERNSKD